MRVIFLPLFLALLCGVNCFYDLALAQKGSGIAKLLANSNVKDDEPKTCEGSGFYCSNCTTLKMCTATGAEPREISCPSPTSYCDKTKEPFAICIRENQCGISPGPSGFSCPAPDGYFPDLTDCHYFFICVKNKASRVTCPASSVYIQEKATCMRQTTQTPCQRVNCLGHSGLLVAYPGDSRLYAMCQGNQPLALMQCEEGKSFSTTEGRCGEYCTKEGNMKKTLENTANTQYYMCVQVGTAFSQTTMTCPEGSTFDTTTLKCSTPKAPQPTP